MRFPAVDGRFIKFWLVHWIICFCNESFAWFKTILICSLPGYYSFRRFCHRIVNLRHFDNFMLVIIMLSSVTIAIEDPVHDNSPRNKVKFKSLFFLLLLLSGDLPKNVKFHGASFEKQLVPSESSTKRKITWLLLTINVFYASLNSLIPRLSLLSRKKWESGKKGDLRIRLIMVSYVSNCNSLVEWCLFVELYLSFLTKLFL